MKKALIIVDVQNDFCKNGSLEVKDADSIVEGINDLMKFNEYDSVIATKDWHPQNHSSFLSNNPDSGIWPDHCVQSSKGSELHPNLNQSLINHIILKGENPAIDSYSGFFDNDKKSETGLNQLLLGMGITEVDIVGLALDYCVKATALDAQRLGYKTSVIENLTRAVNLNPNDAELSIKELLEQKIQIK